MSKEIIQNLVGKIIESVQDTTTWGEWKIRLNDGTEFIVDEYLVWPLAKDYTQDDDS